MVDRNLLDTRTIQRRVKELAASLGQSDFTIRTAPMGDGSPHIEVTDAYYFVVSERGSEFQRKRTNDVDELLYWIMEDLASSMAWDYELENRRTDEDSRILAFTRKMELIGTLSPDWEQRWRNENWRLLSDVGLRPDEGPHSNSTIT